jgi:alkyldihydroxyacetonephosphate synthase
MNQWRRWPDEAQTLGDPAWNWLAQALGMPALLATPPRAAADVTLPQTRLDATPFMDLLGTARVRQDAEARLRHGGDVLKVRGGDLSDAPELVLLPRDENDVLAILKLCMQTGISACVFGAGHAARPAQVCIDMTGMTRLMSVDAASGLAEAEAGITGDELARQLAARGLMLDEDFGLGTLGGRIALGSANWLADVRLATPRGLIASDFPQAAGSRGTLGAITAATVRIQAIPTHPRICSYVFPDFTTGLTALREAGSAYGVHLSDEAESDFQYNLRVMDRHPLLRWLERSVNGATLTLTFPDLVSRLRFARVARRLNGRRRRVNMPGQYRHLLLDRGVMVERWQLAARWSQLSVLRSALRTALDQAMRTHAPREGAHGLVLGQVRNARCEGADLVLTAIWPRLLNGDVDQAQAIRAAAKAAIADHTGTATRPASDIAHAIKLVLDPKGILPG